jgi:hypothetical protein
LLSLPQSSKKEKERSCKEGEEFWIVFFKTRNLINNSSSLSFSQGEKEKNEEDHINIRNKYYEFFCKAN